MEETVEDKSPNLPDAVVAGEKSNKLLSSLIVGGVIVTLILVGIVVYALGVKRTVIKQTSSISEPTKMQSHQGALSSTIPVLPTAIPALTANWKTYANAQWGVSFKYPEEWLFKLPPQSGQAEDAIIFYPNWVTPFPGAGFVGVHDVLIVKEDVSRQTTEEFIHENEAHQKIDGRRILMIDGKPADAWGGERKNWFYSIKPSDTKLLILSAYNETGAKELDTIVSTIKFTNE